jgi:hypothetical protein
MPMNFRTHGHGQGYLDVNGLIPETVERVDYRKGPYRADAGDFSFVGSAQITPHDTMQPFALVEGGQYGYQRFVAGGSAKLGGGDLLLVGQAKFSDGPWELPEDFDGYSGMIKYSVPLGDGQFQASLNVYDASWAPTEQTPERTIGTPLCEDRYCSLDPTLRGPHRTRDPDAQLRLAELEDHRLGAALRLEPAQQLHLLPRQSGRRRRDSPVRHAVVVRRAVRTHLRAQRRAGAEGPAARSVSTRSTRSASTTPGTGVLVAPNGPFSADERSIGLYAEAVVRPVERLMIVGGLRGDWYRFETEALGGPNSWSGTVKDHIVSPKIGVNYEVADGIALYANWGEGFHSNDARGVTSPTDPAPGLVEGTFKELGGPVRAQRLILTAVYWWSYIGSELIYVGDSGAVEPSGAGRRTATS